MNKCGGKFDVAIKSGSEIKEGIIFRKFEFSK